MKFDVANKLIEIRKSKSLTANKLCTIIEVHPTTINKFEKGYALPSLDMLERICDALEITLAEFFSIGEGSDLSPELHQLLEAAKGLPPDKLDILKLVAKNFK